MRSSLMVLLLGACACIPRGRDVPDIRSSVGRLTVSTPEGGGSCTGWIVGREEVLTAGHCDGGDNATYAYDGLPAVLDAVDHDSDLAAFHVLGLKGDPLRVADSDPCFGCQVSTVGYPAKILIAAHGYWSGREDGYGVVDLLSYFGASGSPILDRDGHVVGSLDAIRRDFVGVTFVVPQDKIRDFLESHHIV